MNRAAGLEHRVEVLDVRPPRRTFATCADFC